MPDTPPTTRSRIFLLYVLPALLWASLITIFSQEPFSGGATAQVLVTKAHQLYPDASRRVLGNFHAALRKSAHVFEYMIFALLVWRLLQREAAERWRKSWAVATAVLGLLLAGADELHQFYTRGREGSIVDVGWDALGVALALGFLYLRARPARATSTN